MNRSARLLVFLESGGPKPHGLPEGSEILLPGGGCRGAETREERFRPWSGSFRLACCYALKAGFDAVIRLRPGDDPAGWSQWIEPFQSANAPAAFVEFRLGGRLPAWVRAVAAEALRKVPLECDSDDSRFDAELTVQLREAGLPVAALPGAAPWAWSGMAAVLGILWRARLHRLNLLYERKFDLGPVELTYDLKLGFSSSHTLAIEAVQPGACVLDIGCGQGLVARELARKAGFVTGIDQYAPASSPLPNAGFVPWNLDDAELPVKVADYDQIFMLDVIEHLRQPEAFMEALRAAAAPRLPEVVLTTGNVAFAVTRLLLLLGRFDYGRKGILDRTHTRLFTFKSLRALLEQSGYEIVETRGIPAPFPKALGDNALARGFVRLNQALIRCGRGLFAYQIFIRARALPSTARRIAESFGVTSESEPPSGALR